MNRKIICLFFTIFISSERCFSFSIKEIVKSTINYNLDIQEAKHNYQNSTIISKTHNGIYSPEIIVSSSVNLPPKYNLSKKPDYTSTSISVVQLIPGGTALSISGENKTTITNLENTNYYTQTSNINFSLSQSLFPFWIQDKSENPVFLNEKQNEEYLYNQYLYTKKTTLLNLFQIIANISITKKEIQSYINSINQIEMQLTTYQELINKGKISSSSITELLNIKWNYQQNFLNSQKLYYSYIQSLKEVCCYDFEEQDFGNFLTDTEINNFTTNPEDFIKLILNETEGTLDPLEENLKLKIEILKTNRILEKQDSAPTITISFQPNWSKQNTQNFNYSINFTQPSLWSSSINFNLSPLFSTTRIESKTQYEQTLLQAQNIYDNYLFQKKTLLKQYQEILNEYKNQSENLKKLYRNEITELEAYSNQFKNGLISESEYNSYKVTAENCKLNIEILNININIYEVLIKTI